MHRILSTCLVIVLAAGPARAGNDKAGTTAGNFLSVGTGASVLSMGGAAIGAGADLQSAAWNPAALARVGISQFSISHATLAEQSSQDHLAVCGRFGHGATRWAATLLHQGDGSFDGRDASNNVTTAFNVSSLAAGLQLAHPLGDAVTAGVGASWLTDNLGDTRGTGIALDFGLQARTGPFGLGIAARNVGGSMSYSSGRYDLPAVYGVGAAWSDVAHGLRLAVDANFPSAYYNDVRVGGEWRWQDRIALRGGYRMELGASAGEPLGGPSFGMGAGANGVWMDYAYLSSNASAQGQHRLALTFRPGVLNGMMRPGGEMHAGDAAPAQREAVAVASPPAAPSKATAAPAPAPRTVAVVAPSPAPATPDAAKRLPPGASDSESRQRRVVPNVELAVSRPVRVPPLDLSKPSGSVGDHWAAQPPPTTVANLAPQVAAPASAAPSIAAPAIEAPHVAAPRLKVPHVAAPAAAVPTAVAAVISAPTLVAPSPAPPAAAPPAAARPTAAPAIVAQPVVAQPVVAPPAAATPAPVPTLSAPTIVAAPVVAAAATPAPVASHPARPVRTAHPAPAPAPAPVPTIAPAVPTVSAPVAPESAAAPAPSPAPQVVPAAPQAEPEPAKPAKPSPWPTVSAVLPSVQLAGSSPKVAVVNVPANAPTTEPISKAVRPVFVLAGDGETLDTIAKRWDTTVPALMMENNLVNLTLKRGKKLVLPPPQHR